MILDTRCGHGLRVRDVRVVPVDKDSSVGNVLCQKISWPELAILVRPCLEWMVGSTSRIEAVDENKARENA